MKKIPNYFKYFLYIGVLLGLILTSCVPKPKPGPYYPGPYFMEEPDWTAHILRGPRVGSAMLWPDYSELCYVPGGEYTIGGVEGIPEETITVNGFWITCTEISRKQYANCVDAGVCTPPASEFRNPVYANHPVIDVTWDQAATYCGWIGGQLPFDFQWEVAARGSAAYTYPWGNNPPNDWLLNYMNNIGSTVGVSAFAPGDSIYGVRQMAGNVFEWVLDGFEPGSTARTVRSSAFWSGAEMIPSALRYSLEPSEYSDDLGFRCGMYKPTLRPPYCETISLIPEIPTFERQPGQPSECEPPDFEVENVFHESNLTFVNLKLNRTVEDPEDFNVTGNGEPLECEGVVGAPNRLSCYSSRLPTNAFVEIAICGPDCPEEPSPTPLLDKRGTCPVGFAYNPGTRECEWVGLDDAPEVPDCPDGYYFDTGRQTCLPIPGGPQNPECPERYYFDIREQTCVPIGNQDPDCPDGYTFAANDQTCLPGDDQPCPDGTYLEEETGACLPIPEDTQCPDGFYFDEAKGMCVPIPGNEQPCPEGTYLEVETGACLPIPEDTQCPDGFYFDEKHQTCLPIPGGNQQPDCPDGYYFDPEKQTCVERTGDQPDCPDGFAFAYVPNTCEPGDEQQCDDGFYFDVEQQACLPIPGGTGDCPPSFTAYPSYGCLPDPDDAGPCPTGFYFDLRAQRCVPTNGPDDCAFLFSHQATQTRLCYDYCLPGFRYNAQLGCCEPEDGNRYPDCPPGYFFAAYQNSCEPGDGQYPDCPDGYYFDPRKQTCVPEDDTPDCPEGQFFLAANVACDDVPEDGCPDGYYFDEERGTCLPIPGGNQQPDCPDGYYYSPERQSCIPVPGGDEAPECPDGWYFDEGRQTCLPIPGGDQTPECPPGYVYNAEKGTCELVPGTAPGPCPEGYYFDPEKQTCEPVPEQCPEGYYFDPTTGECQPRGDQMPECPDGYYYNEKTQRCEPGIRRAGLCSTRLVYLQPFTPPTATPVPVICENLTEAKCKRNANVCKWVPRAVGKGGDCLPR